MAHDTIVYVGLDVHKDSITAACVGSDRAAAPVDLGTVGTQQSALDRLIKKLSGRGPLRFGYEAGPCGFWLQRYLRCVGQECVVAAPSLIPRRPGVRIRTDRLDARNLALALRAGTLTSVHIPSPEQEAFRDVVRAWQQSKRDVSAAKQRLKALLASAPLHGVARLRPKRALLRSFAPPGPDHTQRQSLGSHALGRSRVVISLRAEGQPHHRTARPTACAGLPPRPPAKPAAQPLRNSSTSTTSDSPNSSTSASTPSNPPSL